MIEISSDQKQIILGTLLGNGCLRDGEVDPYLVMRSRCPLWLESKAQKLQELEGARWEQNGNYYWKSNPDECLRKFKKRCYEGKDKCAKMPTLDLLRNLGLMVWYGDVGCLVGGTRRNACLRTQFFGQSCDIIKQYFNEVQLECKINLVRQNPVIVFSFEGTKSLMNLVGPILPKNRLHLVPNYS